MRHHVSNGPERPHRRHQAQITGSTCVETGVVLDLDRKLTDEYGDFSLSSEALLENNENVLNYDVFVFLMMAEDYCTCLAILDS